MKVVDVTEFYSERGGGVRSYLESKEHILCQLGHREIIVAPGPVALSSENVKRVGGPTMPYDATYHLLWRPDKIREVAATERPDVLEIHSPYVAAMGALASARRTFGVRTFVWHSDFIDTYERVLAIPSPLGRTISIPLWAWVRTIARGCAATFCGSVWQAQKLARHGVPAEHLAFGVDKDVFVSRSKPRGKTIVLACVGRLAIEKRWDVVLEAFARLGRDDVKLVVLGDGPERARLEKLARNTIGKNVYFAGFEKDRTAFAAALASADALVHGCPHETFGIAIAEAIASGVPIVVPDEGGAAELAQPEFAETYRAGDAQACAAAITRLLARDPTTLRDAAARARESIVSTRQHFERLVARYDELLARASHR
jgi:alpha-1,6-mannosyltransferase